jgi:hypothetical protein
VVEPGVAKKRIRENACESVGVGERHGTLERTFENRFHYRGVPFFVRKYGVSSAVMRAGAISAQSRWCVVQAYLEPL